MPCRTGIIAGGSVVFVPPLWITWDAGVYNTVLTSTQSAAAVGESVSTWKGNTQEVLSLVGAPNCQLIVDGSSNTRRGVSKNDTTSFLYYPNTTVQYHDRAFLMAFRRLNDSIATGAAAYIFAHRSRNVAPAGSIMIYVANSAVYLQVYRNLNGVPTISTVVLGTLDTSKFFTLCFQLNNRVDNSFDIKWMGSSNKTLQSVTYSGSMAPTSTFLQPTSFGGVSSTDGTGQYLPGTWTGGQCAAVFYEMRISIYKLTDAELQTEYNTLDAKWLN